MALPSALYPHVFEERESGTFNGSPINVKNTFISISSDQESTDARPKRKSDPNIYSKAYREEARGPLPSTVEEEDEDCSPRTTTSVFHNSSEALGGEVQHPHAVSFDAFTRGATDSDGSPRRGAIHLKTAFGNCDGAEKEKKSVTFCGSPSKLPVKNTFINVDDKDEEDLDLAVARLKSDPSVYSPSRENSRKPSAADIEDLSDHEEPMAALLTCEVWAGELQEARACVGQTLEVSRVFAGQLDSELKSCGSTTTTTCEQASLRPSAQEDLEHEFRTTVMIRGLPEAMTRQLLEDLLRREGFLTCIDFMYVPADLATGFCFCHAFVNLVSSEEAKRFRRHFTGFKNWPLPGGKDGAVDWSEALQGLEELIERYRNSPLMHRSVPISLRPTIYCGGSHVEFPPPTIQLKAPRARRSGQKKKQQAKSVECCVPEVPDFRQPRKVNNSARSTRDGGYSSWSPVA